MIHIVRVVDPRLARSAAVVFQYSIERSCRFSIVMIQESAEPLASDDPA